MTSGRLAPLLASGLLVVCLMPLAAQGPPSPVNSTTRQTWTAPRAADGHPSLEGVWENNSATPLERPAQFANKPRLTDEELAALVRRAKETFTPDADAVFGDGLYLSLISNSRPAGLGATGTYAQNWLPDRYFEHRTSLIVDPSDGKLP